MENLFIKASKKKFRFPIKGNTSVEDLWNLSEKELNELYGTLNASIVSNNLKLIEEVPEDEETKEKLEIIRYVFNTKKAERIALADMKERKEKKAMLLELIEKKKFEAMSQRSIDELQDIVNQL